MMKEFSFSTKIEERTIHFINDPESFKDKFYNGMAYDKMPHSKRKELLIYLVKKDGRKLITFSYAADLFMKVGAGASNGKNLLMKLFHDEDFINIEREHALMLFEHLFVPENQNQGGITFNSLCLTLED
jgi:hypothetical protein